jgi:tRNA threonylcarbamoyladenosine biosynthesis protein TsaB
MLDISQNQSSDQGLPVILALDTSSKLTSIAIARGDSVIANFEAELDDNRSARLWELLDFLLQAVGLKIEDVTLFAACSGPGGFTGLRVGIAAIKGLAVATGKSVIGVTSLEALAASAFPATEVCILSNAYKGEVYAQRFSYDRNGIPVALTAPSVCLLAEVLEKTREVDTLCFAGDGADLNREVILQYKEPLSGGDEDDRRSPGEWEVKKVSRYLARPVARLAYNKFLAGEAVQPEALMACYVRSADVKIKQV